MSLLLFLTTHIFIYSEILANDVFFLNSEKFLNHLCVYPKSLTNPPSGLSAPQVKNLPAVQETQEMRV